MQHKSQSVLNRITRQRALRPWARRVSLPVAFCFAGSFIFAPAAQAITYQPPKPPGHVRRLTKDEMHAIAGAQHQLSASALAGETYHWEASVPVAPIGSVNTANGNLLSSIPIVSWTARGGMPVNLTLYHNSEGNHNDELGQHWTHSYDIYLYVYGDEAGHNAEDVNLHWGTDLSYDFTLNIDGSYTAPTGIYDTMTANTTGGVITSYDVKTKNQVKYHFTNPNSTGFHCATISDLNGNTITINRNSGNYVTSIVDPTNRTITYNYTSGKISSFTDPLSRTWSISYTSGKLTQITYPTVGGNSYNCQFSYDSNYDITTYQDRRGNSWTFNFNSDCSLNWSKDPPTNQTSYSYTSGQTVITDPNSHTVKHNFSSGRLSSVNDQLNNTESYSYTSNCLTGMTDRRSKSWSWTYDSKGNVLTATDPLSHTTTWTFNSFNEPLTVVTHMGTKQALTYDAYGNPTQIQEKDGSNNVLSTTSYTWNNVGTLASKTDNNSHTTSYGYNTDGRLTSVTTPANNVTSITVNSLGICTSRTDSLSNTTNYTLDNWNRLTTIDYPSGTDPTFTYDAENNLTAWTDANGSWARTYDSSNRQLTESKDSTTELTLTYDDTGKKGLLSTVTAADTRVTTNAYTSRNELYTAVENSSTATYGYDANGNETSVTNPTTSTVTNVYDDANRLTSVTNKNSGGTTLSSFSYAYNNDNLRMSCTEANGDVVSYGYSANHRLTSESRTGSNSYSYSYTLDGVGNRTSQTKGGTTTSFTLDSDDELTATSTGFTNSYSYNARGDQTNRTLSGTSWTLAYDYENQLTSTATGGSTVSTFTYDALGRRYSRTNVGTTTRFYYGPSGVICEKQGNTFTAAYAYGNDLIRKDGEYPMFDGLGSVRTTTNSSQTVTATATYEGFGATVASSGSTGSSYLFKGSGGYRTDGDAGLEDVGFRYYDPQVGRFISRDFELDQHPYAYCEHDPINLWDRSGMAPEQCPCGCGPKKGCPCPYGPEPPSGTVIIPAPKLIPHVPDIEQPWYWHPIPGRPGFGVFLPIPDSNYRGGPVPGAPRDGDWGGTFWWDPKRNGGHPIPVQRQPPRRIIIGG